MTNNIKLLPLPEGNVAHLIAAQDAEIKALRRMLGLVRSRYAKPFTFLKSMI